MKLTQLFESLLPKKAGFIPYFREGDSVIFAFHTPSDPKYGGDRPAIAKGGIDEGESPKTTGIREGQEELGLKLSNLKKNTIKEAWRGELTGDTETYIMSVYIGEVKSKDDFNDLDFESLGTIWLTVDEFKKKGRKSQAHIVETAAKMVGAA